MREKKGLLHTLISSYKPKAEKISSNPEQTTRLLKRAARKADKKEGMLKDAWGHIRLFIEMVRASLKGEYKLPIKTLTSILAGLLYFASPVDLIPDFIAGLGLLDDAAVIGFVVSGIRKDLDAFETWKSSKLI